MKDRTQLKVEFGIGVKDMTELTLNKALSEEYNSDLQMVASQLLWFYQEVFTVLRKDWAYMRDMKRVLVGNIMHTGFPDEYNATDFAPLCGDKNVSMFYVNKHRDKLSNEAKEMLQQHANEIDKFLHPIESHLFIGYMANDDSF